MRIKFSASCREARFTTLDARYADEQDELSSEIEELEQAVSGYEHKQQSAEKIYCPNRQIRKLRYPDHHHAQ